MTVAGFRRSRYARPLVVLLASLLLRSTVIHANDVTPPAPPPPRPAIVGFVDTHLHQFANLGFGGLGVWGSPVDPSLDPATPLVTARARALPNSDFIYVPMADASEYMHIAGTPIIGSPAAEVCDDGSCWPECPAGTGVAANACVRIRVHGAGGTEDVLNEMIPNGSPEHGVIGYPDMNGWPAFDVLTAQQAYWEWLQRAHDHGMKLIVMLAVNNQVLCQATVHRSSYGCGDDDAVRRQIKGAKDLETYIDARAGGPGQGFYKIVRSSEEARTAIQNGKLAVVLGTEVDTAWGCTPSAACNDDFIQDRVQEYYDDGIRVVYPVHLVDNKFGGTAVYTGLFELANFLINGGAWFDLGTCGAPIEWRSDIRDVISTAKDVVVAAMIGIAVAGPLVLIPLTIGLTALPLLGLFAPVIGPVLGGTIGFLTLLGAPVVLAVATVLILDAPGKVGDPPAGNCNNRGLTDEGATLVNALMDRKMIIDVDHTDTSTFDAIMDIAETRRYPGMVSGHTGLVGASLTSGEVTGMGMTFHASESGRHEGNKTDEQVQRIIGVGGFLSLGLGGAGRSQLRDFDASDDVAFECGRSSQAFAQQYLYATQTLGLTAVGFGSDINGFAGFPTPRYGAKACNGDFPSGYQPNRDTGRLVYDTALVDYYGDPLDQYTFGNKTWDFNTEGFAHVGLYPDFIADLGENNLSNAALAPLFNGAEAYVRMWEKIDDVAAPTVNCGTVGEDWHADDVAVPCLSYDFGWGLADGANANFSLTTSVPNGTETDNASTGTHVAICDSAPSAHCTGVIPAIAGINVDKKDPTVTVTAPAIGTPAYLLNQVVTADYGCADGGSGVDDCAGTVASGATIDTASVGPHAFSVTGSDNVGHVVTVAQPYNVTFNVCVQFDQSKTHKAGSVVPIKLAVCDAAGANVSSSAIVLTATGTTQLSTSAPGVLEDAGNANPDNAFRFVSGSYVFNLKTTGMSTGTYALTFTATGDPIPHQVQFQVR